MKTGYTHVYTGNGKGKTTTMLGLALRAVGAGLKIYIGQFHKNDEYSEVTAIRKYLPDITLEQYGAGELEGSALPSFDITAAKDGLKRARQVIMSGEYDVVMLDEINIAVRYGLINSADVVDLIHNKPQELELVLTGRSAMPDVVDAADLVSNIQEVKHYFGAGVAARVGIEK